MKAFRKELVFAITSICIWFSFNVIVTLFSDSNPTLLYFYLLVIPLLTFIWYKVRDAKSRTIRGICLTAFLITLVNALLRVYDVINAYYA